MLASLQNGPKHPYLLVFAPCVVPPTLNQRWSVTEYGNNNGIGPQRLGHKRHFSFPPCLSNYVLTCHQCED